MILRILYAMDQKQGGSLEQRLKKSKKTALDKPQHEFNMSGLVQPSVYGDIVFELKPHLRGTFL